MDKGMVEVLGRLLLTVATAIAQWFTSSAEERKVLLANVQADTKLCLDYMEDFERRADSVLAREINEAAEKPSRDGSPNPTQEPPLQSVPGDETTKP